MILRKVAALIIGLCVWAVGADAQWLKQPTAGIPRTPDGNADLNAPAPRSADGKPDLSGLWSLNLDYVYVINIAADLKPDEISPSADALFRQRMGDLGKDDSSLVRCLPRGPRHIVGSWPAPDDRAVSARELRANRLAGDALRSWSVRTSMDDTVRAALAADTELLEYVCNENETRRTNLVGRTDAEKRLVVPSETLTEYVGTYVTNPAGPSALSLTVRLRGGELFLDMNGKGNIPLVPLSPTTFSIRLANFEFFRNDRGEVAGMVDNQGGVRFTRQSP